GFSEQRTNANYFAASSVFSKPSLWIIFGLTVLGGTFGGIIFGYGQQLFGIFCTLFFIGAFSRLIVEVAYLLYLRTKDKSYWEEVPKDIESQNIWNVLTPTKTAPRLIYETVLWAVLRGYVLPKIGASEDVRPSWVNWGANTFYIIMSLDYLISFVRYQIKKRKKGK
ncbi:hypothetical protein DHL47_13535, partial [Streptococcus panodentis]|nr:hypothetical protein [Streptococcus panodentis]